MMNMKSLLSTMLVAGIALMANAGNEDSCSAKYREKGDKIAKELGLSADQKAKLKELRGEMKGIHKEQSEKMKALLDSAKEELLQPNSSKEKLYEYAKASGELRRTMAEREADHLLKIKAILTPEQFQKLLSKRMRPEMGGHPQGFHEGGRHAKDPHGKGPHQGWPHDQKHDDEME